jgi:hypothetical protein
MASYTTHYHLLELNPGTDAADTFSLDGYKFTSRDRAIIDALSYLGAEAHHHTGLSAASNNPASGPGLVLSSSGGSLAAGTTYYYEYTYVDPNGLETAPSPTANVTTASPVATPNAPSLSFSSSAGTLPAGSYLYCLTAYTGVSLDETLAGLSAAITTGATGEIIVTFPAMPGGGNGWNIYRFDPSGSQFLYVTSIAAGPSSWTDNGSIASNCNRTVPVANTTNSASSVTATVLAPPAGYTWNLYRTTNTGDWGNTLISSGLTSSTLSFVDTGAAAGAGTPPTASEVPGTPSKVLLTGGAEVQGLLPPSMIDLSTAQIFPDTVSFTFYGFLAPTTGTFVWVCPFASATIVEAQAALGRGSVPASQAVIVDVLKGTGVNPSYSTIYTSNPKPQIAVGKQIGAKAVPNITTLSVGDSLSVDIDQAGGGATPTDHDLTVTIWLLTTNN